MNMSRVIIVVIILISLTINGNTKEIAEKDFSSAKSQDVFAWLNHNVQLKCQVAEENLDRIVWKMSDELLAVGSIVFTADPRIQVTKSGVLLLEKAQLSDSGNYICQSGGRSESEKYVFQLTVREFKCEKLKSPNNGEISFHHVNELNPFTNNTVALYTCNSGFTMSGLTTRKCTDIFAKTGGWEGQKPFCFSEELFSLEKRLVHLEKKIIEKDMNAQKLEEKTLRFNTERIQNLEKDSAFLSRKQTEIRDWTTKEMEFLRNVIEQMERNTKSINFSMEEFTTQLSTLQSRVQLLSYQLEAQVDKMETLSTLGSISTLPEKSVSPTFHVTTRLMDLTNLIGKRLESLEKESLILDQNINTRFKLMERADSINSVSNTWEETQKHIVARCKVGEGGKLFMEYLWIVRDVKSKLNNIDNSFSIQSRSFYTNIPGYRLRLVLYPNYDGAGELGLFIGLLPGEFDGQISWPFNYSFQLAVVSHSLENTRDHVGEINMPSTECDLSNFQRQLKGIATSACGFRYFMNHRTLLNKNFVYFTNGHLWIRTRIFM